MEHYKLYPNFNEFQKEENGDYTPIAIEGVYQLQKAFFYGPKGSGKSHLLSLYRDRFPDVYHPIFIGHFDLSNENLNEFQKQVIQIKGVAIIIIDNLNVSKADRNLINKFIELIHGLFSHFVYIAIESNNISAIRKIDGFSKLNTFSWVGLSDDKQENNNTLPTDDSDIEKALSKFQGNFYLGGSVWDREDQTARFFENQIWEQGREEAIDELKEVKEGDVIFLKSTFAQEGISYLKIKAVGRVIKNPNDGFSLKVDWLIKKVVDIENLGWYRKTFYKVSHENLQIVIIAIGKQNIFQSGILSQGKNTAPTDVKVTILFPEKLKNSGEKERNDAIYDKVYDITENSFVFTINPRTEFWRFGLRFFETKNIEFDLNSNNRHANRNYKDLHLSGGYRSDSSVWKGSNRIELNQYYFQDNGPVLKRCETYQKQTQITFKVTYVQEKNKLEVSFNSNTCENYTTFLDPGDYKYFKIFAWADGVEFEIDFVVKTIPVKESSSSNKIVEPGYTPPDNFSITEDGEGVIGVNELAEVMTTLLKNLKENDKGKMIGIFGPWGRGKTFLVDKIWNILDKDESKPFIRVNFHAWKYQDTPASWAYLYEAFATKYFSTNKKWFIQKEWEKFVKIIELNWKRIGWKPLVLLLLSIAGSVVSFFFIKDMKELKNLLLFFGIISATIFQIYRVVKDSFSEKAKELFKKYYTKVSFTNLLGTQAEIQRELKLLLTHWIKEDIKSKNTDKTVSKRILLFVDDIDRCNEERIMSIIDALRVMLEDDEISKRVVVLAAIDERVLKRAIKWKYHDLLQKDCEIESAEMKKLSKDITSEYMDKLFLAGIHLGILTSDERKKVLSKYIQGRIAPKKQVEQKAEANSEKTTPQQISNIPVDDSNTGSSSSNTEQSDNKVEALTIDGKKYDLTNEEEILLSELMEYCSEFTPRQIRIFYYRYLLARNLLKRRYERNGIRLTYTKLENLGRLLMHYSLEKGLESLKAQKLQFTQSDDKMASFPLLRNTQVFVRVELVEFLEVLEIVISY